jgi:hypothetical protein
MKKVKQVRTARYPKSAYHTDLAKVLTPFAKRAEQRKKEERKKNDVK